MFRIHFHFSWKYVLSRYVFSFQENLNERLIVIQMVFGWDWDIILSIMYLLKYSDAGRWKRLGGPVVMVGPPRSGITEVRSALTKMQKKISFDFVLCIFVWVSCFEDFNDQPFVPFWFNWQNYVSISVKMTCTLNLCN